jgi:hypothetical protein
VTRIDLPEPQIHGAEKAPSRSTVHKFISLTVEEEERRRRWPYTVQYL